MSEQKNVEKVPVEVPTEEKVKGYVHDGLTVVGSVYGSFFGMIGSLAMKTIGVVSYPIRLGGKKLLGNESHTELCPYSDEVAVFPIFAGALLGRKLGEVLTGAYDLASSLIDCEKLAYQRDEVAHKTEQYMKELELCVNYKKYVEENSLKVILKLRTMYDMASDEVKPGIVKSMHEYIERLSKQHGWDEKTSSSLEDLILKALSVPDITEYLALILNDSSQREYISWLTEPIGD